MQNKLNNLVFRFLKHYYYPNLRYLHEIYRVWEINIVKFMVNLIFSGFITFICLKSILMIFPKLSSFIFLGSHLWQIPFIVLGLGLSETFVKDFYIWFRKEYKEQ